MSNSICTIKPRKCSISLADFPDRLHQSGLLNDFEFNLISSPVHNFREEFLAHLAKHGFSSIYNFAMISEDITSPSMNINDIETVVCQFLANLNGVKKLVVIDPYFYSKSQFTDVPTLFKKLISGISTELQEIVFITNGRAEDNKVDIHKAVNSLSANIQIQDFTTDEFHDRYWIDPDNNVGIVMGTSLNGLGKKIALVDKLNANDVAEIVKLASGLGAPV